MRRPAVELLGADERGAALLAEWSALTPRFVCVLAHTDTCLIPGLSAAGATEALRPFTPAADAEVVAHGQPRCLPELPSNPLGPPGPSGITRAALQVANIPWSFVGLGLRVWPDAPCERLSNLPGGRIDQGVGARDARRLFEQGLTYGAKVAEPGAYLVLGESVPGGTTTALALLEALGIDARGRVSGSLPGNAHALKQTTVAAAFQAAGLQPGDGRADPLGAVERMGDPMQPFVAGCLLGATQRGSGVLLAGGSQMAAVAALAAALAGPEALRHVALGTTPWVAHDPHADLSSLAAQVISDSQRTAPPVEATRHATNVERGLVPRRPVRPSTSSARAGQPSTEGSAMSSVPRYMPTAAGDEPPPYRSAPSGGSPGLPVLVASLDFSRSRHPGLRQYEHFLVKEGVGAGGACLTALLRGVSLDDLHAAIDATYDHLLAETPAREVPA